MVDKKCPNSLQWTRESWVNFKVNIFFWFYLNMKHQPLMGEVKPGGYQSLGGPT